MADDNPQHTPGLIFRKLDLHMHTPASADFDDRTVSPAAIVEAAIARRLEAIAVTDHNSGQWVDEVKAAASARGLTVFPGVEITCVAGEEGIHIIALLDTPCGRADVESLLSELGLQPKDYGDMKALVKKNPFEVVNVIHQRGGLSVLAHANSTRGALNDMRGEQRTALVRHPCLYAAEATDFQNDERRTRKRRVVDLLDGTDPEYRRKLAVYQASDNPGKEGGHSVAGIGTRCAYFKMDCINLESLRQCFVDPDVRIRQDFEFTSLTYPRIRVVRVKGGFLDGVEIPLHEGLNSVLGAKGAGKSLLVEFMRFALDQPPVSAEIRADHDAKLGARLQDYGTVQVVAVDETGKELTLTRTYSPAEGSPYQEGAHLDLAQVFPVLFLSQNEIIKIAEHTDEQLAFIDTFFDFRSFQVQIRELERDLSKLDGELAQSMRAFREAKDLQKQVDTVKTEIGKLALALKNPVFEEYTRLEAKDGAFRQQIDAIRTLRQRVTQLHKDSQTLDTPTLPPGLNEDASLRRTRDRGLEARAVLERHVEELARELDEAAARAEEEHQKWLPDFQVVRKKYDAAIQEGGGDYKALAQRRAKKVKEQEDLSRRFEKANDQGRTLKDIGARRKATLEELRSLYAKYSEERKARCAQIEVEAGGRLRIRIHEASNVEEFRDRLSALKRGSYLRDSEIDKLCASVDPGSFMRAVISYSLSGNAKPIEEVAKRAALEIDRMRVLAEFLTQAYQYEQLLSLEYQALPKDRPEILYNVGRGTYEPVARLSVGQKCTAMLIVALSDGAMPIVIDQPEDSLDIRSVWEDICCKVRRGKERRQFIFTTHNSSVAVATDSDKFIVLEGDANRGRVVHSGSMDHRPMSDEALKYLEGGFPTYRMKFRKYRGEDILREID